MDKKRIAYIDIAKFFGIFLLLFEHTGNSIQLEGIYTNIKVWICSFHMPLFFIVYGMVVSSKNWKVGIRYIDKKIKTLLVPYIIWCMIYSVGYGTNFFYGVLYGTNPSLGYAQTNMVLWFLPVMFLSTIIFQCLIELNGRVFEGKRAFLLIEMIGCMLGSLMLKKITTTYGIVFGFDIALSGVSFIILGQFMRNFVDWMHEKKTVYIVIAMLMVIVAGFCGAQMNPPENCWVTIMALGWYGRNYIMFIIVACLNTLGIVLFSMLFEKIKLFEWLGKRTLVIMAVHYILFVYTIGWTVNYFAPIVVWGKNVFLPLFNSVICIAICIPILLLVDHYAPILKGK